MRKSASQWILELLPGILLGVIAVENTKELAGQGAKKKAVVMAAIEGAVSAGEALPEAHVQTYSATVERVVKALYPKVQAVTEMPLSSRSGFGSEGAVRQ